MSGTEEKMKKKTTCIEIYGRGEKFYGQRKRRKERKKNKREVKIH